MILFLVQVTYNKVNSAIGRSCFEIRNWMDIIWKQQKEKEAPAKAAEGEWLISINQLTDEASNRGLIISKSLIFFVR